MDTYCGHYVTSATDIYGADSAGYVAFGVSKLVAFLILCGYNARNYYIIHSNSSNMNASPYTKGIVLPIYSVYLYCFLGFTLFFAIVDIINLRPNNKVIHLITTPLQTAIEQCLLVSLSIFMMNYGAGVSAIKNAFVFGFFWGLFTFCVYFLIIGMALDMFPALSSSSSSFSAYELILYLVFLGILSLFYIRLAYASLDSLYRRPACIIFAKYNIFVNAILCCVTITLNSGYNPWQFDCFVGLLLCSIYGILFPIVIYHTLQVDSQYWSGLETDENNPLKEVWESMDVETAVSVATTLSVVETQKNRKFPMLHFGLLQLEKRVEYIAGGSSRVYFGYLGKEKVALKMLFAMELAPFEVKEFYKEACVLGELKHPNIIQCLGVCVMPPALTLVLEYCKYGSLFEFLYNAKKSNKQRGEKKLVGESTIGDYGSSTSEGLWQNLRKICGFTKAKNTIAKGISGSAAENPLQYPRGSAWDDSVNDSNTELSASFSGSQHCTQQIPHASNTSFSFSRTNTLNSNSGREDSSVFRNSLLSFMDFRRGSSVRTGANTPVNGNAISQSLLPGVSSDGSVPSQSSVAQSPASTYSVRHATKYLEELQLEKMTHNESISGLEFGLGVDAGGDSKVINGRDRDVSVASNRDKSENSFNGSDSLSSRSINTWNTVTTSTTNVSGSSSNRGAFASAAGSILGYVDSKGKYESEPIRDSLDGMPAPKASRAHYLTNEQKLSMVMDAVRAIAYLHSIGYMHCDIKSLNFLVTSDLRLKLSDMGESRRIGSAPKREVPPIPARNWVPPEVS